MAARYWVGGTATWDNTAGTKWALTSGGTGGEAVPTSADDVFFDAASGVVTCTIGANSGAKSITCTGFTGTLAGSTAITVSGSVTLVTGMTLSYSGTWNFVAAGTLITAGKTLQALTVTNGAAISLTLGSALTVFGAITVNSGRLLTAGYNVTASSIESSNTNIRTIDLSSSTVILSSTAPINFTTGSGLTFTAGTSSITLTASISTFSPSTTHVITFYNVSFTNRTGGVRAFQSVAGGNEYNNLTIAGPTSPGLLEITFNAFQTINGGLNTDPETDGISRVLFRSATPGIAQTIRINGTIDTLEDADFRDIYIIGPSAPISGLRLGNLGGCSGITFSTPKTVYWSKPAGGSWSAANAWSTSSGGLTNTANFPLAQDTAIIDNAGLNTFGTITLNISIPYMGTIDMSSRTNAMTLNVNAFTVYGNWINGAGVTPTGVSFLTFSGRKTQTITSSGNLINNSIIIDSYGGTVELVDALNIGGSNTITVTNGTFDTKGYAVTAVALSSTNSNVRAINLGSSTVTLSSGNTPLDFTISTNLSFNCGTSSISFTGVGILFSTGNQTFYDVTFANTTVNVNDPDTMSGSATFRNFTIVPFSTNSIRSLGIPADQTITGILTVAGATPTRRIFIRSNSLDTPRTLIVGTLAATDCDFRDITIAGAAANSTPTRAGDCGGNSNITFPAAKTVYWNLAGTQNWSAVAWADVSGGTPAVNNFPLAQDVAVFNNTGAAGTVTVDATWNIGTFDASARTSAMTLTNSTNLPAVYGDWKFGTGVTSSVTATAITFSKQGTQTITSNGVVFGCPVTINRATAIVQLADAIALTSTVRLTFDAGTFDAVNYNVTSGYINCQSSFAIIKMGTGTWTASADGTNGNLWDFTPNPTLYIGSANIVLSNTGTTARIFAGGSKSYNKLTIGGTTGTSTLTITGNNQFTELASTKAVAHTIALGTTAQTFGKWSVSGTAGNVVTVTGTGTSHIIAGARVTGVDYLAMGTIGFSSTSPGEFYAGANSTGSGQNVIKTAAPTPVTRYWRGGTGTWDATSTTNWSATSGGAGGASVPTSADAVVFNAASNATAYTVTCTATQLRCGSLTFAAPASGAVTWAGSGALAVHDNFTLPATGLTRTYSGTITLSGSTPSKTFTTNGVVLASNIFVNGFGCEWSLGSAVSLSTNNLTLVSGGFDLNGYNFTAAYVALNTSTFNSFKLRFGNSTLTLGGGIPLEFFATNQSVANLDFNAGTSQINCTGSIVSALTFKGNNQTFYNVAFTNTSGSVTINGANTFNNLSSSGITTTGLKQIIISANQTVNGTLTLSAGINATMRHFVRSDTIGTPRTLTCAGFSGTDADFRDITIAGAAAPASGTRLGDRKGNSGITFPASKNVYCVSPGTATFTSNIWSDVPGGAANLIYYPLPQDDVIFTASLPSAGSSISTTSFGQYIRTLDTSARVTGSAPMTFAMASNGFVFHGDLIIGTGVTVSFTNPQITAAGRTLQKITSSGKTLSGIYVDSIGGTVRLEDAFQANASVIGVNVERGTFDANGYNVTLSNATNGRVYTSYSTTRSINIGSGNWTLFTGAGGTPWDATTSTNLTVTGNGRINLNSASAKTFAGGSISYAGITLDQSGAGTLTITGNNTFADISNTYRGTGATTIALGTTTQRVGTFSASGAPGAILTITGTSATSPATLIYTGSGEATPTKPNRLTIIGVRAYNLADTWYAGANSTNQGSLGWIFAASSAAVVAAATFFLMF